MWVVSYSIIFYWWWPCSFEGKGVVASQKTKCWKVKAIKHITIFNDGEDYLSIIAVPWGREASEHLFFNGFPWQWPGVLVPD